MGAAVERYRYDAYGQQTALAHDSLKLLYRGYFVPNRLDPSGQIATCGLNTASASGTGGLLDIDFHGPPPVTEEKKYKVKDKAEKSAKYNAWSKEEPCPSKCPIKTSDEENGTYVDSRIDLIGDPQHYVPPDVTHHVPGSGRGIVSKRGLENLNHWWRVYLASADAHYTYYCNCDGNDGSPPPGSPPPGSPPPGSPPKPPKPKPKPLPPTDPYDQNFNTDPTDPRPPRPAPGIG